MSTMATTKDSSNVWNTTITPTGKAQTLRIATANTYLDRDIEITIAAIPINYQVSDESLIFGLSTASVSNSTLTVN